jgi:hypothetical protein
MGLNPPSPFPSGLLALVGAMAVEPTCLVVEVSDTPVLCMVAGVDGAAWAIWLCFHGVEPPLPPSPPVCLLWLGPWRSSLHAWWLKSATRLCYAWAGVDGAAWAILLCFHGVEPPFPPSPPVCLLWLAPWRLSLHA